MYIQNPPYPEDVFGEYWEQPKWICWKMVNGRKIPLCPNTSHPKRASVSDPSTWSIGPQALKKAHLEGYNGVGLVFENDDGLVGVDLDDCVSLSNDWVAGWAREILEWFQSYTELSPSRTGLTVLGKGDLPRHGYKNNEVGLEIYSARRYFAITLDHKDVTHLEVDREINPCQDAINWLLERYFPDRNVVSETEIDTEKGEFIDADQWLEDALSHLDPDCRYDEWVAIGQALYHGFDGSEEAFNLWESWSSNGEKFEENSSGEMRQKWNSFSGASGPKRSLKTIWYLAEKQGWEFDSDIDESEIEALIERSQQDPLVEESDDVKGESDDSLFSFHSYGDIIEDESPLDPFLIEPGFLGAQDIAMLFAPPKSMKSMMCLDQCVHWACGKEWMGLKPHRPLRIAMFNYELKYDTLRRRADLLNHKTIDQEDVERVRQNLLVTERFNKTLSQEFITECYDSLYAIKDEPIDLIVIDPLVNMYNKESENSNEQAQEFMQELRVLARTLHPDCAIYLVHHIGKVDREEHRKNPFNSLRGATSFRGSYDTGVALNWKSEERDVLEMHFEFRLSSSLDPKELRFEDGCFEELESSARDAGDKQTIVKMVKHRAESKGRVYTQSEFAEKLSDFGSLGSERTIVRKINELVQDGQLDYFDASKYGGEAPHSSSKGHLYVPGMQIGYSEDRWGAREIQAVDIADEVEVVGG